MSDTTTTAASTPGSAPASSGATPDQVITITRENEGLKARLDAMERANAKAAEEAAEAHRKKEAEWAKTKSEADAQAAKLLALSKRNAVLAHFGPTLVNPEYLKLAPEVELDDNGALTADSAKALKTWRDGNPNLFVTTSSTTTPRGGSGAQPDDDYTPEQRQRMAANRIKPDDILKRPMWSTFKGIFGHNSGDRRAS